MKKTTLILSSSLFALCAMATVDISGLELSKLPAAVSGVYSITTDTLGDTPAGRYVFEADDLTYVHRRGGPRHLANNAIIDTNGKTGIQFVTDDNVPHFGEIYNNIGYNYFGFNGVLFVGGGEISIEATEQATPVWLGAMTFDNVTANMNLGEYVLKTGTNQITIKNGSTLNWNTTSPTLMWSQSTGKYSENTSQTQFISSGSLRNTLNMMSGALTYIEGVGDVLLNICTGSELIDLKFDESLGDDIIMYNNHNDGLYSNGRGHSEAGRKITYMSALENKAALRMLLGTGDGTYVFDFDGEMAGGVGQIGNADKFTVEIAAGRNITMKARYGTNSSHLILHENAVLTSLPSTNTSSTTGNNHVANLTMKNGSQLIMNAGFRFRGGEINGDIFVNGTGRNSAAKNADDFTFGFYGGNFVFGENATLTQAYQSNGVDNWTYITKYGDGTIDSTKITTNSAKGSINLGNKLTIARGTVFVMNSTDAYILGSGEAWQATSQATSIFNFTDYFNPAGTEDIHTRFEINAANNIGAFSFDVARVLEIAFGEDGSLVLGEETGEFFNSLRGNYLVENCILIDGLAFEQLKVYDVSEEDLEKYFSVLDEEKYKINIVAVDGEANAFWVNAVAVPEPAEWAMIFGAIALGFVAYRRRK